MLLGSYVFVFPPVRPQWDDILASITLLGLGTGAALAAVVLLLWVLVDLVRTNAKDRMLAVMVLVVGFFLFDSLEQLSEDRIAFLETFVTALAGILIALAVEAKAFSSSRA
jgi:hypothetical protein